MAKVGGNINKVFAGMTAAAGATAVKSLGEFRKFEDGMNEVFTLLPGTTQAAFDDITNNVLKLSMTHYQQAYRRIMFLPF